MEAGVSSETMVRMYQTRQRHIPEYRENIRSHAQIELTTTHTE
jgi:hypothetical protein